MAMHKVLLDARGNGVKVEAASFTESPNEGLRLYSESGKLVGSFREYAGIIRLNQGEI